MNDDTVGNYHHWRHWLGPEHALVVAPYCTVHDAVSCPCLYDPELDQVKTRSVCAEQEDALEIAATHQLNTAIRSLLESLPKRERVAIVRWFGIACEPSTLREIGLSEGGYSRERIRQLAGVGIGRIRTTIRFGYMSDAYYGDYSFDTARARAVLKEMEHE